MTWKDTDGSRDREAKKFAPDANNKTAVNVINSGGLAIPPHDTIDVTYPTTTTEVFTYSLSTVTVATVTLTYTNTCKDELLSAVRT